MTNALIETTAASGAMRRRLARLARHGVAMLVLAGAGIGAAQAQYHGRRDDAQLPPPPSPRAERLAVPPQIDAPREQRMLDQQRMAEERRQAVQMMQHEGARDGGRRGGRLTPDERRELRRQVNEAGMDLYPNRERR